MKPAIADLFERRRPVLIAGPCVIESKALCLEVGAYAKERAAAHGFGYVFKASFDKANRTSLSSFRGPGIAAGLQILNEVGKELDVPTTTDIHTSEQAEAAAEAIDLLQIPAFLCRQTDLILAAAKTGVPTNIKKGQFLAPEDMRHAVDKFKEGGGSRLAVTERGSTFGYHNLVVDMRGLVTMSELTQCPVIFDATHSVQRPSAGDGVTSGDRAMAPVLARAAMAVGVDGIFAEVHPRPSEAKSDGPNTLDFDLLETMLAQLAAIHRACSEL